MNSTVTLAFNILQQNHFDGFRFELVWITHHLVLLKVLQVGRPLFPALGRGWGRNNVAKHPEILKNGKLAKAISGNLYCKM